MKDTLLLPTRQCDMCAHSEFAASDDIYGWCKFPLPYWALAGVKAHEYRGKKIVANGGSHCATFKEWPLNCRQGEVK